MEKFLIVFMAVFLSAPSMARVCMLDDPSIMVTHAQLDSRLAALEARIIAAENSWISSWISVNGDLGGSTTYAFGQSGTWSVTTGGRTASGASRCSSTSGAYPNSGNPSVSNGQYCWCKMDVPYAGAWVFLEARSNADFCASYCAYNCVDFVQKNATLRAAVLALP